LKKIRSKVGYTNQNPEQRRPRKFLKAVLCLAAIAACAFFLHVYSEANSYHLSSAATKLLSKTAVDNGQVNFKNGILSYNQADQSKGGKAKLTVAGPTNSTSQQPYRVTLASKAGQGITFTGSSNDLPFKLIPLTPTGNGRYLNGRMVYPSDGATNVYTLRRNGVKEDIIMNEAPGKNFSFSWKLELGGRLTAKLLPSGGVGIYSANPIIYDSNLQVGDAKTQALIDKAKQNGQKDTLIYMIPAPYIKDAKAKLNARDVKFALSGDKLTLTAQNLTAPDKHYPLSIDPTIVTTTTADFATGYSDGNIDYSTADEINRGTIGTGLVGTWNFTSASTNDGATFNTGFTQARYGHSSVAYNGYLYVIGGISSTSFNDCTVALYCNGVQYAPINSNGTIGAWHYTHANTDDSTTFVAGFTQPRYGHTSVVYNGYLYVIGGLSGTSANDCTATSNYCNGVQYAPINSNGTVGTWSYTTSFTAARQHHSSVAYNDYLYVIGGIGNTSQDCSPTCNGTQYAAINANGTIGTWHYTDTSVDRGAGATFSAGFTWPRYGHTSVAYNGYLYVIGGFSSNGNDCPSSYCNGVQFALINANGTIGSSL
jgi:hypothetical protein